MAIQSLKRAQPVFRGAVAFDANGVLSDCTMRCISASLAASRPLRALACALGLLTAVSLGACRDQALKRSASGESDAGSPAGLTPAQAAMVLARVGDQEITLGQFAASLERMDQFDRLRYQTPERRKELLDQMVTVELLAKEARRRGLDKDPETQAAMRQALRDVMLTEVRRTVRSPGEIPDAEVRAYYDAHQADYQEPERRRVSEIVVKDKASAEKALTEAKKATSPADWGTLVLKYSVDYKGKDYKGPKEAAGDLGIVGPPSDPRGSNPRVSPEARAAVFQIAKVGDVLDHVISDAQGNWHVLRLVSRTEAHTRAFSEAERTIRVAIIQQEISRKEQELEMELRKQFPVTIDEQALSGAKLPAGFDFDAGAKLGVEEEDDDDDHDHDHKK